MRHASLVASALIAVAFTSARAALAQAAPVVPAPPPAPAAKGPIDLTTLESLRERGILSQAEYELALRDIGASTGAAHAGDASSLVVGKWVTTVYGFLEADAIYDTTQSFGDLAGGAQVLRGGGHAAPEPASPQTYGGDHGQTTFSIRNSRFGLRLRPPGTASVHASGLLEMDLLGSQSIGTAAGQVSEGTFFTSPTLRVRHAMLRVETPVVDVLAGQYWHLFGWQSIYQPNTVEIQGVPGELYARTPQVRLSKTFRGDAVTVEAAIAALRPPSRASEVPEAEAGVRIAINGWTGMQTVGATATSIMPASIALTGDYRHFEVPEASTLVPTAMVHKDCGAGAVDVFLPVLPAREDRRDGALSLTGEVVYGAGIGDLYSGLVSGVQFPNIPNTTGIDNTPTWPQNVDNGLVDYDIAPGGFALHAIQWTSAIAGLQYYLPGLQGRVWVSGNYSHMESSNTSQFARPLSETPNPQNYYFQTSTAQVRKAEDWWDANVFFDPLASVRVGLEVAAFYDRYVDGYTATNYRAQASGFFVF